MNSHFIHEIKEFWIVKEERIIYFHRLQVIMEMY